MKEKGNFLLRLQRRRQFMGEVGVFSAGAFLQRWFPKVEFLDEGKRRLRVPKNGKVGITAFDSRLAHFFEHHQGEFFPLGDIPAEFWDPYFGIITRVSEKLDLFPEYFLGIHAAEQNGEGICVDNTVSSIFAVNLSQIIPKTWNGWHQPGYKEENEGLFEGEFLLDQVEISRYFGIGADFRYLDLVVSAFQREDEEQRRMALEKLSLLETYAHPLVFENCILATGLLFREYGLKGRDSLPSQRELWEVAFKYSGESKIYAERFVETVVTFHNRWHSLPAPPEGGLSRLRYIGYTSEVEYLP